MTELTRQEHIQWCKARAMEYLDHGEAAMAVTSMLSDMSKHPETKVPPEMGVLGLLAAQHGVAEARRFIEGF